MDDSAGSAQAIKNDIQSFQFATPRGVLDVTGVDKSAIERLLLHADYNCTFVTTAINFSSGATFHDVFKTVPSTSVNRTVTLTHSAKTLANEVLFTDYQVSRNQDGSLGATVPGVLADGAVPTWA